MNRILLFVFIFPHMSFAAQVLDQIHPFFQIGEQCSLFLEDVPGRTFYQPDYVKKSQGYSQAELEELHMFFKDSRGGFFRRSYEEVLGYFNRGVTTSSFDMSLFKDKLVVDLGAGGSNFIDVLHSLYGSTVFAVDYMFHPKSPIMQSQRTKDNHGIPPVPHLEFAENFHKRIGASLSKLPFQDQTVDFYVATEVFQYLDIKTTIFALAEIMRTLKVDGEIFMNNGMYVEDSDFWSKIGFELDGSYGWVRLKKVKHIEPEQVVDILFEIFEIY